MASEEEMSADTEIEKQDENFLSRLREIRWSFARRLESYLVGPSLPSIISEDCWGGECCRRLGVPYNTPLAGISIPPDGYLSFLENIGNSDAFDVEPASSSEPYPVGRSHYCSFHFMHYHTWEEALAKFQRRAQRLRGNRLCYKIDFGKAGYTQRDVERWNRLALEPAIALLPPQTPPGLDFSGLTRSVVVPDWNQDGSAMFSIARRHFDFYHWLRTGGVRKSPWITALHFLFFDPLILSELKAKIDGMFRKTAG
jgi:uncharacterized protein (DUF1919 family)